MQQYAASHTLLLSFFSLSLGAPTGLVVGVIVAVIVLVIAITILVGALWYTGRLESCLGSPSSSSSNSDAKVHMLSSSM